MPFDPFKDFETKGYVRNSLGSKDLEVVKASENIEFQKKLTPSINLDPRCILAQ